MIEAIGSTLLVGTLAVASMRSSAATVRSYFELSDQRRAAALAELYLTEIMQSYYEDPVSPLFGPEPDEPRTSRAAFDDVDDFHGCDESPPQSRTGALLDGFGNTGQWRVQVTVNLLPISNSTSGTANSDTGLKRITVTVTTPAKKIVRVQGLRSRYGGNDRPPNVASNFVQGVELSIRKSGLNYSHFGGTQTLNHATSAQ
ncbi:MAG: hypothetical protein KF752_12995 [Pirellulaceae bacterium]|nr:hypothetical protein [Pirellulaceae bacterium]